MPSNEVVPHKNNNAHHVEAFIERNEMLKDAATRRDYFEQLSEYDFIDLVQRLANIVRTGDENNLQHFDGDTVRLAGHEVPDQRDKEALLVETWQAVNQILHDRELSDEEALTFAGLTAAGGVLMVHPFADGNGRTSRMLSYMIARGAENKGELEKIWASSGGGQWQVGPPAPLIPRHKPAVSSSLQPDKIEWDDFDTIADDAQDAYGGVITASRYSDNVVRQFVDQSDKDVAEHIRSATNTNEEGTTTLDASSLLRDLEAQEGSTDYIQQLYRLLREQRAQRVRQYLNLMQDGTTVYVKQPLLRDVEKRDDYEIGKKYRNEIAKRAINNEGMILRDQHMVVHRATSDVYHQPKAS